MKTCIPTLVIGIGNPLRGDDGAGLMACRLLHRLWPSLNCITVHQLVPELAETVQQYEQVLFVDAAVGQSEVQITPVSTATPPASSGHHISPYLVIALTAGLYGKTVKGLQCSIPAFHFHTGAPLSDACTRHTAEAVTRIEQQLNLV